VVVHAAGRTFTLTPREAGVRVGNPNALAAKAVAVSRSAGFFSRVSREVTGGSVHANVSVDVQYSRRAVDSFVSRVTRGVDRPARDAQVVPSVTRLHEQRERAGRKIDATALRAAVMRSLGGLGGARQVTPQIATIAPKVTRADLARKYPAYIVVDRGGYTLKYYRHLKLSQTFPIAVGMQGLETPAGLYDIQWKQVNPPWYVPNSSWAGSLAGKTIPPGPQDPLKARFMAFNGGAGIHGIDPSEYGTIGHNASHGCVRMTIPDVIKLYSESPVGTPVYVG
jgi:lipoprotein-anchoring transpeptidase ErfK/SrfK